MSAKEKCSNREKPVRGSWVAKDLLRFLRDCRKSEAESIHDLKNAHTEEIEWWEETIRETVNDRRRKPRDILELDSATVAALDELFCRGVQASNRDAALQFRRRFALKMIREGCEAVIRKNDWRRKGFLDFAIEFRGKTEAELETEQLVRQVETLH